MAVKPSYKYAKQQGTPYRRDYTITDDILSRSAVVFVDMQQDYCSSTRSIAEGLIRGNDDTEALADKVASIAPEFNAHGLDVVWLSYGREGIYYRLYGPLSPLHKITPHANDTHLTKYNDSGFAGEYGCASHDSVLADYLSQHKKDHIFLAGVNANGCVIATLKDGLRLRYKVTRLRDLCANDQLAQRGLKREGLDASIHFYRMLYNNINADLRSHINEHYDEIESNMLIRALKINGGAKPEQTYKAQPHKKRAPKNVPGTNNI